MVKYAQENADKGSHTALKFTKLYNLDLIDIPEKYKDVASDDVEIKLSRRHLKNKRIVRNRQSRDLSDFDAWRCHDRSHMISGPKQGCSVKM